MSRQTPKGRPQAIVASSTIETMTPENAYQDDEDRAWAPGGETKADAIHVSRKAASAHAMFLLALAGATIAGVAQVADKLDGWPAWTGISAIGMLFLSVMAGLLVHGSQFASSRALFEWHFEDEKSKTTKTRPTDWLFFVVLLGHPRILGRMAQFQQATWMIGAFCYTASLIGLLLS